MASTAFLSPILPSTSVSDTAVKLKSPQFNTASIDIPRLSKIEEWAELNPEHTEFKRHRPTSKCDAVQIMQDQ